jgi:hypothetical protein
MVKRLPVPQYSEVSGYIAGIVCYFVMYEIYRRQVGTDFYFAPGA